jgi:chromosome segregation ATPase
LTPLLDQLLLPQRLAARVVEDVRRIGDAAVSLAASTGELRTTAGDVARRIEHAVATLDSLHEEIAGVRAALKPMSDDFAALRHAFADINDHIAGLNENTGTELRGVRTAAELLHEEVKRQRELIGALDADLKQMGQLLAGRLGVLNDSLTPLVRDADEVREVVEPLQGATERIGRLAERLPGSGRKE